MFKSYNLKWTITVLVFLFAQKNYACGSDFVTNCGIGSSFTVNGVRTNYTNDFTPTSCGFPAKMTNNFGFNVTELKLTDAFASTWESCTNNVIRSTVYYRIYENALSKGAFMPVNMTQLTTKDDVPYFDRTFGKSISASQLVNLLTGLKSNTNYTFEMYFEIGIDDSATPQIEDYQKQQDNNGNYYSASFITGVLSVALPVELLGFQAQTQGKNALLTWQTASEKDNTGFKIERSVDAQKFENIGFVVGNGTTSEKQSYSFTDETPLSMGGYYRLCQVDNNGIKAYSKTVYVANAQKGVLTLSPNPAYDRISLGLSDDVVDATVTVFDMMGRVLLQTKFTGFNADLDISGLIGGTYCATVTTARESLKKIFVKR